MTGFANMVKSMVQYLSEPAEGMPERRANIIPGWVEPADMREIKRLVEAMGINYIMFPDTSGVLDTPLTGHSELFPAGGTTIKQLRDTGRSKITFALGEAASGPAALQLDSKCKVPYDLLDLPIDLIGIASTCLSETIGENVPALIEEFRQSVDLGETQLVFASTPSYAGSHLTGFHKAVLATAKALAVKKDEHGGINIMPGMISPADIRYIKRICQDLGISAALLPDYSDTLDGVSWPEYHCFPEGGTPVSVLKGMGGAKASIELCRFSDPQLSAASFLEKCHGLPAYRIGLPVGVRAADEFMDLLSGYAGRPLPDGYTRERGRLLDAYVDAHKYVFGRKALVYGDADFVMGIGRFLAEIGMVPALCTADKGGNLAGQAEDLLAGVEKAVVLEGADFADIETLAAELKPDIFIGSSKGYKLARSLGVPLVRLGFPVHDRLGGARLRCVGYAGTQELFDRIVNALLEHRQDESDIGYSYM